MRIDQHSAKINDLANGVDFFQPIHKVHARSDLNVIKRVVTLVSFMLPSNPFIVSMIGIEEMNDKDIAI
ncbi:hypothetical protein D3C86_2222620 [compost metagenome]